MQNFGDVQDAVRIIQKNGIGFELGWRYNGLKIGLPIMGMVGYSSNLTVSNVKKPKGIEYSIDSTQ